MKRLASHAYIAPSAAIFLFFIFSPNLVAAFLSSSNESLARRACFMVFSLMLSLLPLLAAKKWRHFFIAYIPFAPRCQNSCRVI